MEDIKIQLTEENIQYKKKLNVSFAKLTNTLIHMCASDKELEAKVLTKIGHRKDENK